jgi:hypothetical protein
VKFIVNLVRPYFAPNGGPIVLLQIENEYWDESQWPYIEWCGELAASLHTGIPWEMCNGLYANNTIETCNSCDCASWVLYVSDHQHKIISKDKNKISFNYKSKTTNA